MGFVLDQPIASSGAYFHSGGPQTVFTATKGSSGSPRGYSYLSDRTAAKTEDRRYLTQSNGNVLSFGSSALWCGPSAGVIDNCNLLRASLPNK